MSKIKEWALGLPKYYQGPDYSIHDPRFKEKDRNNFVIYIALALALVFFIFLRGNHFETNIEGELVSTGVPQAFYDIANAASYPFTHSFDVMSLLYIVIPTVFIGYAIVGGIIARKHQYHSLMNAIYTGILGICLYFFLYELVAFECWRDNRWFIFIIMMAPFVVFMYGLGIHTYRLSIKVFSKAANDISAIEVRKDDYLYRTKKNHVWVQRFGVWFAKNWGQVLAIVALLAFAISVCLPVIILLYRSIKSVGADLDDPYAVSQTVQFENFRYAWDILRTGFLNSAITTICVTIGVTLLASILAYGFIRFAFPGKKVLYFFIIALMMIPSILTLVSRYQLVQQMGMSQKLIGIILPGIVGYIPASFMLIFTFFSALPKDLFEAADVDGATDFSVYWNVVVPLSKPILTTIAIQTFVGEWNDYLWAKLIIGTNESIYTLPVLMTSTFTDEFVSFYGPYAFAGYILSALPLVLVFIVASKQFIEGLTSGAFKM